MADTTYYNARKGEIGLPGGVRLAPGEGFPFSGDLLENRAVKAWIESGELSEVDPKAQASIGTKASGTQTISTDLGEIIVAAADAQKLRNVLGSLASAQMAEAKARESEAKVKTEVRLALDLADDADITVDAVREAFEAKVAEAAEAAEAKAGNKKAGGAK